MTEVGQASMVLKGAPAQLKRSASFAGGALELSALAKLPLQLSPSLPTATFYGSGISDLRACMTAQQRQLDGMVDKVSILMADMHKDLSQDIHLCFEQDLAAVNSKLAQLRHLDEKVESRVANLRQSEGEMHVLLQNELRTLRTLVSDELHALRERANNEFSGVHSRMSYIEKISAETVEKRWNLPAEVVSPQHLSGFASELRSELQEELSRMAEDLYSRCSANNIEAETVERLCSVEAHASALRKQVAELTAQLEEQTIQHKHSAQQPHVTAEHFEQMSVRVQAEIQKSLELRMAKALGSVHAAVDEISKESATTRHRSRKMMDEGLDLLRQDFSDKLLELQRAFEKQQDQECTAKQLQEVRCEGDMRVAQAFREIRGVTGDLQEDMATCLSKSSQVQKQVQELREEVNSRLACRERTAEEELPKARSLEAEVLCLREECHQLRVEQQEWQRDLGNDFKACLCAAEEACQDTCARCEESRLEMARLAAAAEVTWIGLMQDARRQLTLEMHRLMADAKAKRVSCSSDPECDEHLAEQQSWHRQVDGDMKARLRGAEDACQDKLMRCEDCRRDITQLAATTAVKYEQSRAEMVQLAEAAELKWTGFVQDARSQLALEMHKMIAETSSQRAGNSNPERDHRRDDFQVEQMSWQRQVDGDAKARLRSAEDACQEKLTRCEDCRSDIVRLAAATEAKCAGVVHDAREQLSQQMRSLVADARAEHRNPECHDPRIELETWQLDVESKVNARLSAAEQACQEKATRCEQCRSDVALLAATTEAKWTGIVQEARSQLSQESIRLAAEQRAEHSHPEVSLVVSSRHEQPTIKPSMKVEETPGNDAATLLQELVSTRNTLGSLTFRVSQQELKVEELEGCHKVLTGKLEGYLLEQKVTQSLAGLEGRRSR
mmetsp:Transcript_42885/g.98380  ORF Transcript_42885/g.98380 Transcript_42885/m.98380 type:complete len:901 (+) Transcript_42885:77-2779(+)